LRGRHDFLTNMRMGRQIAASRRRLILDPIGAGMLVGFLLLASAGLS
jgi:hypothetical protein